MNGVLDVIWHGLRGSFLMAYQVWWALVIGFAISAIVQSWVPRQRIEHAMSGDGARPVAIATGLGAASSSCSYAAIAIAKSLFQKGASGVAALAFQFASTNLVWELGLVLWVLIGWQFTVAEYVGGLIMIVIMTLAFRVFVPRRIEQQARVHATEADTGHQHHMAGEEMSLRQKLTSASAWSDVAHNFRGDWQMLYKEVTIGFFLAGFIAQLGNGFFNSLFLKHSSSAVTTIENVIVGPIIAVLSFVCSVGNVPLAAVLWSGGISFAGVLAFLFADLIVLPIIVVYRKYYGLEYTVRIVALMFVTMVAAGLIVNGLFSTLGILPSGLRPTRSNIFGAVHVDYKLFLNLLGIAIFSALFWLTARRGATDPVCGMKVDRSKAVTKQFDGRTFYFCSNHCLHTFEADPANYIEAGHPPSPAGHEHHAAAP
ncbi:MAG: permease [Actinomycetota bacterium]|nr:permease [Actinomycetota bacterium]